MRFLCSKTKIVLNFVSFVFHLIVCNVITPSIITESSKHFDSVYSSI